MFVLNVWKLDMTNDVLASCVDEQRGFLLYETKIKTAIFTQKTSPMKMVIYS